METSFKFIWQSAHICSSLFSRDLQFNLVLHKGNLAWEAKNSLNKTQMIRDCRSWGVSSPNFEEDQDVEDDALATIGAPILHTTERPMELPNLNIYNIHGAYSPFCPVEESQRSDLFTSLQDATYNFITQFNFSNIMDDPNLIVLDTNESRTATFETEILRNRKVLSKVFRETCNEVINWRKKTAKDLFFKLLGYKEVYRDKDVLSQKTRFKLED